MFRARRSFLRCASSSKNKQQQEVVTLHNSPIETPYLLEAEEKKAFIDPGVLRAFLASFLVGSFSVASMYWLMSHRVSNEAMHRRRFIQSMTGTKDEDYDAQTGKLLRRRGVGLLFGDSRDQPFEQFVSPSCNKYRELLDQVNEADRIIALENEANNKLNNNQQNNNSSRSALSVSSSGISIAGGANRTSLLSEAVHMSTLHETAVDRLKMTWNDSVENVQEVLRSMMNSWVDQRERDTIAAVEELARGALGEENVVVIPLTEKKVA